MSTDAPATIALDLDEVDDLVAALRAALVDPGASIITRTLADEATASLVAALDRAAA